jgi:hypothetical protein
MARSVNTSDNYLSRVLKHIPTEIVLAYISIEGILRSVYASRPAILEKGLWTLSIVMVMLTPLWLWRVMKITKLQQLTISTLSVPVWLFAIGGPFVHLAWYEPALGGIALPLYTLCIPILLGKQS